MMTFLNTVRSTGIAVAFALAASATSAAVIDFDDQPVSGGPNNTDIYGDFSFNPSGGTNDTKCYTDGCLKEVKQGEVTTMTRTDGGTFTLDGFYFNLVGNGNQLDNTFRVESNTGTIWLAVLGDLLSGFTDAAVSFVNGTPDTHVSDGTVEKNQGYFVDFSDQSPLFAGVEWIKFGTEAYVMNQQGELVLQSPASAQARLDCIFVDQSSAIGDCSPDDDGGTGGPSPVPIPAGFPLLASALGAAYFLGRRRRS